MSMSMKDQETHTLVLQVLRALPKEDQKLLLMAWESAGWVQLVEKTPGVVEVLFSREGMDELAEKMPEAAGHLAKIEERDRLHPKAMMIVDSSGNQFVMPAHDVEQ